MKILFSALGLSAIAFLGLAPQAEARTHSGGIYISGYQRCGTPIYSERYVVRYRHHVPVWGVRLCPPPVRYSRPVVVAPAYCAPRRYVAPGVVFQASYTRHYSSAAPVPPVYRYDDDRRSK